MQPRTITWSVAHESYNRSHDHHKQYRRLVGKIQWLAYTRPDISRAAKELARSLQPPTQLDNKRLKHMIRYLKGTRCMRHNLRPKIQTQDKRISLNIDTYTDANWASCETTRKSATGFVLYFFGAAVHYGSRAQATIALSSAESELYAREPLHQQLHQGSICSTHQHQDTHTQQRSKVNNNERRRIKESTSRCDTSSHNNLSKAKSSQCAK